MRVNEFIKKFGWEIAKRTLVNADGCDFIKIHGGYEFKFDDLKHYVDAYELVKDLNGLDRSKEYANSKYTAPEIAEPLKQAITLVEECQ